MTREDFWVQVTLEIKIGWAPHDTIAGAVLEGVTRETPKIVKRDEYVDPELCDHIRDRFNIDIHPEASA